MSLRDLKPDFAGHAANGEVATGCAACPHPWTTHDAIAARYCTATVAGKFSRGCVCTAYQNNKSEQEIR